MNLHVPRICLLLHPFEPRKSGGITRCDASYSIPKSFKETAPSNGAKEGGERKVPDRRMGPEGISSALPPSIPIPEGQEIIVRKSVSISLASASVE